MDRAICPAGPLGGPSDSKARYCSHDDRSTADVSPPQTSCATQQEFLEFMAEHPDRDTLEFLAELLHAPPKISKHMIICGGNTGGGKSFVPVFE